jgi:hypothetical protein
VGKIVLPGSSMYSHGEVSLCTRRCGRKTNEIKEVAVAERESFAGLVRQVWCDVSLLGGNGDLSGRIKMCADSY